MSFLDDFLLRAALAGVGVAIASAPLGCFVIWRKMAYFGDATAHAAILGVALALWLDVSIIFGVLACALTMAICVTKMGEKSLGVDATLGVLSHAALALGLVAVSLQSTVVDLDAYLFGDILAVRKIDVLTVWIGALLVCTCLALRWRKLLTCTLHPDLASSAGLNPQREQLWLTLLLAIVVAIALKVVGALLISALLIIPAATARAFSKTPEQMVFFALLLGGLAALGGLWGSYMLDTPTGPSIVSFAAGLFFLTTLTRSLFKF